MMQRQANKKPAYNKRLLGPRPVHTKAAGGGGGGAGGGGGGGSKLPSYKNRMRSIQRLLNKVCMPC